MSATRFDRFHFDPAFRCDVDAEPADGLPNYLFGRDGRRIEEFELESRWGTPLVLQVAAASGDAWVGTFAAGGLGVERTVCACPFAYQMCVIVDGLAYLVDVTAPDQPATIVHDGIVQVTVTRDPSLLLLVSDTDLSAISVTGVAWSAKRIVLDSLRVLRASSEAIVCSGDVGERMATITISPDTGTVWGSDYR
jgi:hypothetical protein